MFLQFIPVGLLCLQFILKFFITIEHFYTMNYWGIDLEILKVPLYAVFMPLQPEALCRVIIHPCGCPCVCPAVQMQLGII